MAKKKPNRSDGRYEAKVVIGRNLDGTLKRKSFYSTISMADAKKKSEEYMIKTKAENLAGVYVDHNVTFSEWAEFWLRTYKQGKVKENTYAETYERSVEKILIPYFGNTLLACITQADIEMFYKQQAKNYAESTLKKLKLCLSGIFESAIENDVCFKNPAKNIKYAVLIKPKGKRSYAEDEARVVLDFAKTHMDTLPDGLLIWLQLELGLRSEELLALNYSDFDLNKNTVRITKAVVSIRGIPTVGDVKSKRSNRELPISKSLSEELSKRPRKGLIAGKLIDSGRYIHGRYTTWFSKLQKEHDIEKLTPHELRHTCGTLLYRKTGNIYAVSKFLGHSSVSVTEKIYVHDNVEDLRNQLKI